TVAGAAADEERMDAFGGSGEVRVEGGPQGVDRVSGPCGEAVAEAGILIQEVFDLHQGCSRRLIDHHGTAEMGKAPVPVRIQGADADGVRADPETGKVDRKVQTGNIRSAAERERDVGADAEVLVDPVFP